MFCVETKLKGKWKIDTFWYIYINLNNKFNSRVKGLTKYYTFCDLYTFEV